MCLKLEKDFIILIYKLKMSTSVLEKINQTKFDDYLNKMKKDSIESDKSDKSDDNENKSNNRQIIKKKNKFFRRKTSHRNKFNVIYVILNDSNE